MDGSDEVDLFLFYSLLFYFGINLVGLERERFQCMEYLVYIQFQMYILV